MSAGAPWSVKGIDPKAREVAKDLARRSGMTLGELLNRLILEDEELAQGQSQAQARAPYSDPFAPTALAPAYRNAFAEPLRQPPAPYIADDRVAEAIERLSARIEAAERRSALAVSGVDQSVRGIIARLDGQEREQIAIAARFEGAIDELRTEQARDAERLRRLEQAAHGPRSAEALRALEQALGKVAGHLQDGEARMRQAVSEVEARVARMEQRGGAPSDFVEAVVGRVETAEARTAQAIEALGASFSALEGRLGVVEGASNLADRRLEGIAADLSRRMEAARVEMAQKLRASAEGRFDRIEERLAEMAAHVAGAEQRSAQALEQVGGEVTRMAAVMESRVGKADAVQAQALEKLGDEIARITERLTERIANAERRSAAAVDEVGEQVARVAERISQRSEQATGDLAERIRQSEERTARMLEEARQRIDFRLAGGARSADEPTPPPIILPPIAEAADAAGAPADLDIPEETFVAPRLFAPEVEEDEADLVAVELNGADPELEVVDYLPDEEPAAASTSAKVGDPSAEPRPLSTREVIEQARAAARAAQAAGKAEKPGRRLGETRPSHRPLFGLGRSRRGAGGAVQTALMFSGAAAALGAGVAAYYLGVAEPDAAPPARAMQARAGEAPAEAVSGSAAAPARAQAAVTYAAGPATTGASSAALREAAVLYVEAKARIEAKDASGLADMRRAAGLGYTPAQFYLGKLYENGELGVERDLAQARGWVQRAALGGDRVAMHNLALYFYQGQGGTKNLAVAAAWFRKAADLGLVDSQYNLAQLYEAGSGVPASATDAYRWYLIAARGGDADSKAAAARLRGRFAPEVLAPAEQEAAAFRPAPQDPAMALARTAAMAPQIADAQRALSRLGYFKGPADGAVSPTLGTALAAYQRDQNLEVTGALDGATRQKLSAFAR
jgi:localization factor PodJL